MSKKYFAETRIARVDDDGKRADIEEGSEIKSSAFDKDTLATLIEHGSVRVENDDAVQVGDPAEKKDPFLAAQESQKRELAGGQAATEEEVAAAKEAQAAAIKEQQPPKEAQKSQTRTPPEGDKASQVPTQGK